MHAKRNSGLSASARQVEGKVAPKTEHPRPPFPPQHQAQPGLESKLRPQPAWKGERYRPADKLKSKVALITGGDSGIGRSVAYHYAREGADVAIVCLPSEDSDARTVREAIEKLGRRCLVIEGDLVETEFCDACVERTVEEFGKLDILVHNAAWQERHDDIEDLSDEDLDRAMKTNVYAYLRLVRAASPHLRQGSCVIATGSVVGIQGSGRLPEYSATKGAIHALTKTLAEDLLGRGVRVNCVAPGPVWTPLNVADPGLSAAEVTMFGKETGESEMGRPAQPEEIAPAFVFLASEADSSYITGLILPITGGPV